jgi:hypothetical protein
MSEELIEVRERADGTWVASLGTAAGEPANTPEKAIRKLAAKLGAVCEIEGEEIDGEEIDGEEISEALIAELDGLAEGETTELIFDTDELEDGTYVASYGAARGEPGDTPEEAVHNLAEKFGGVATDVVKIEAN